MPKFFLLFQLHSFSVFIPPFRIRICRKFVEKCRQPRSNDDERQRTHLTTCRKKKQYSLYVRISLWENLRGCHEEWKKKSRILYVRKIFGYKCWFARIYVDVGVEVIRRIYIQNLDGEKIYQYTNAVNCGERKSEKVVEATCVL